MSKITLPNMPEGFTTTIEHNYGASFLCVVTPTASEVEWDFMTGKRSIGADIELPATAETAIRAFLRANTIYQWANRAHAPADENVTWPPLCGLASASPKALDAEPVCATVEDFHALPEEWTCWECRSILS